MSKITVFMSPEQASAAVSALNLFNRMGSNQFEMLSDLFASGKIRKQNGEYFTSDEMDELKEALAQINEFIGNGPQGIGVKNTSIDFKRAYELMKSISKAHVQATGIGRNTTLSDGNVLSLTGEDFPVSQVIEDFGFKLNPMGELFMADKPEVEWTKNDSDIYRVANVLGQKAEVIQVSDEQPDKFVIWFMGYESEQFNSIDEAVSKTKSFAKFILSILQERL